MGMGSGGRIKLDKDILHKDIWKETFISFMDIRWHAADMLYTVQYLYVR